MNILWEDAVKFHGHACPGLAMGVRAGQIALKRLGVTRDCDEELIAISETDACSVDGIQVTTGCTLGKGNLFVKDYGKQVFIVGKRNTCKAVKVYFKPLEFSEGHKELRDKISRGVASDEHKRQFEELRKEIINRILTGPEIDVTIVTEPDIRFPERASIFNSVKCEQCGEMFMEPRGRLQDGKIVCLDCYEGYERS